MPDRIEAHTTQLRRRVVAQKSRDVGMRCLMECDGEQQRKEPNRNAVNQVHCSGDQVRIDDIDSARSYHSAVYQAPVSCSAATERLSCMVYASNSYVRLVP